MCAHANPFSKRISFQSSTFKCQVNIDGIRTRKGWNFLSRGGEKCKKGVGQKEGGLWCEACNRAVEYPVLRFRLELDVFDKTASTVVVMFDELATELVKCSAASLAKADEDVGLATPTMIAPEEVVKEDAGSSNVNASAEVNIKEFQRWPRSHLSLLLQNLQMKGEKRVDLEDLDDEVTCDMNDGQADAKDSSVLDKRKKK
ncbi:RNA-directed DNA polymerase, eukaryota, partial [Tanacetum coccineum]